MWCALMLRIGVKNMTKIDFTVQELHQFGLPYEEGMPVTPELAKQSKQIYERFHDKYLSLRNEIVSDEELRYAFIAYDMSLEYFYKQAKTMVRYGNSDSISIFSYYLEYNDCYALLRDAINKGA